MKNVICKTIETATGQGGAMETGDHFKNGANSKKCQMSRGNKKRRFGTIVACVAAFFCASVSCSSSKSLVNSENKTDQIIGVWKQISGWSGGGEVKKIITKDHFVVILTFNNIIEASFGGSCSFDGDTYTESMEYGTPNRKGNIGRKGIFNIQFEDNKMYLSRQPGTGNPLYEIWERIEKVGAISVKENETELSVKLEQLGIKAGYGSPRVKQELVNEQMFLISEYSTDETYGYTESNPIMVGGTKEKEGVQNEIRFLKALVGPLGSPVIYKRLGSCCMFYTENANISNDGIGRGMLDIYEVMHDGLDSPVKLYFNMYDSDVLKVPVGGFKLKRLDSLVSGDKESCTRPIGLAQRRLSLPFMRATNVQSRTAFSAELLPPLAPNRQL